MFMCGEFENSTTPRPPPTKKNFHIVTVKSKNSTLLCRQIDNLDIRTKTLERQTIFYRTRQTTRIPDC